MQDSHDLALLIDSDTPLIILETSDETGALALLTRVAMQRSLPYYRWSITEGLTRAGFAERIAGPESTEAPQEALRAILGQDGPALYALCDFHPFLKGEPRIIRQLKDIALLPAEKRPTLVLISHAIELPSELRRYGARFALTMPTDAELMALVREQAREWHRENPGNKPQFDPRALRQLIANLRGLPLNDARRLARRAVCDDGAIDRDDVERVNAAKIRMLGLDGVLQWHHDVADSSALGGFDNLKGWLNKRQQVFVGKEIKGLDVPKGVVLLGVQGAGKSLAARVVAGDWGVPLLRLDAATLYNKFIGETERNLREALAQAELLAPCVLWVDEIEKGFAVGGGDDGTSRRLLGTLLTWMAERRSPVFVVATANDVSTLPPELLRKGRIDEIFFVDLPDVATREGIFRIHLRSRGFDPDRFDAAHLATLAEDFSGAEIEQAVVGALYRARAGQRDPMDEDLIAEIGNTYPLAVVRAEEIATLRGWAEGRTVRA